MKTLLFSIVAAIAISITFGMLIISGTIDIASILQIQSKPAVTQLHGLPVSPGITISINGSISQSPIPRYDVKPGQSIILAIHVTSDPKNIPVRLYANPKLGFPKASGINWNLYYYQLGSLNDSFLNITIAKNVRAGEYPMEIDANTQAIPNVNFTEETYFDLVVLSPTSSTAQNVSEPSCVTHISNQTVFSGYAGSLSCQVMSFHMPTNLVNYTGFYGMYGTINSETVVGPDTYANNSIQEELDRSGNSRMLGNFVLEPGHNGTITYVITGHERKCTGFCPPNLFLYTRNNVTNYVEIYHHENDHLVHSHSGIAVSYNPKSEAIINNESVIVKAMITVSRNVDRGTYWIILAPGNCAGGPLVLLTVSECEK